jgi:hypothetical protein
MPAVFVALLLAVQLLVAVYAYWRMRRFSRTVARWHHDAESTALQAFRQSEQLQSVYVDLGLTRSLAPTRDWAASPDFLLQLTQHALAVRPKVIVECGSGVSSVVLARCVQLNGDGKLYCLEHDADHARRTRGELLRHGLAAFAEVVDAPLQPFQHRDSTSGWYAVDGLPKPLAIDMLVVDGPPMATGPLARYPAAPALFPSLSPRATVFLDDASRPDEMAVLSRWNEEFPELMQASRDCEKGCVVLSRRGSTPSSDPADVSIDDQGPDTLPAMT